MIQAIKKFFSRDKWEKNPNRVGVFLRAEKYNSLTRKFRPVYITSWFGERFRVYPATDEKHYLLFEQDKFRYIELKVPSHDLPDGF